MNSAHQRTPAQQEAVMTTEEEVLLVAGPGSGKTKTTIDRIKKLIEDGVDPKEIVVISFTNAAAREIEARLTSVATATCIDHDVPAASATLTPKLGYVGTLHGFALRMLKEHAGSWGYGDRLSIVSPESAAFLLQSKARSLACGTPIKKLLDLKAAGMPEGSRLTVEQSVIALYLDELREAGIVDFDVLLTEFLRFIGIPEFTAAINNRFSYLFVDEVQDSAEVDWAIYHSLPMRWKFLVGDPDQSIYGFRGAAVFQMMRFASEVGTHVILLQENFRSDEAICLAANNLIGHNTSRLKKTTHPVSKGAGSVRFLGSLLNEGDEMGAVAREIIALRQRDPLTSIAVLTRTNYIANAFRTTLGAGGIIPILKREVSDLPRDWAFTRSIVELLATPDNDTLAFLNLVTNFTLRGNTTPKQAAKEAHESRLRAAAAGKSINAECQRFPVCKTAHDAAMALTDLDVSFESRMLVSDRLKELPHDATVLDLALAMGQTREVIETDQETQRAVPPVEVLTIHGAKGREFDSVFLVGFEDEVIPGHGEGRDVEEERRLAFVAVTRARHNLVISTAVQRVTPWKAIVAHMNSRFLDEMLNLPPL